MHALGEEIISSYVNDVDDGTTDNGVNDGYPGPEILTYKEDNDGIHFHFETHKYRNLTIARTTTTTTRNGKWNGIILFSRIQWVAHFWSVPY